MPLVNTLINPELQKLEQSSSLVSLYEVDATSFGGGLFYFCNELGADGNNISFNGQVYQALPIEVTGWGSNQTGTTAKPTMSITNLDNDTFRAAVITQGDLVGAKVTRLRTLSKFLDGSPDANGSAVIGPDRAYIEQKTIQNKTVMQFQLGSITDRMGMMLPRRQVLKDENYLGCHFPGVARSRAR
jgi:lambda family phage minor tail protein L